MNNASFIIKLFITIIWVFTLQITVLDNLIISNLVYIPAYLIVFITMPRVVSRIAMMILSFICGMLLDYISGSYGLITSVLVIMAIIRPLLIQYILPFEIVNGNQTIKYSRLGFKKFISYTVMMVLIFNILLFSLEGMTFIPFLTICYKTILSTVVTIPIIIVLQLFIFDKYE